jgi:O-antigen ligase
MAVIVNTGALIDDTEDILSLSFRKIFLFLLLFSIILRFRVPVGDGSVALTWIVISVLLYFYLLKQTRQGFYEFPLKFLAPFVVFTVFIFISLAAAPDKILGLKKLIIWCLGIAALIITRDMVSRPKDRSALLNLLFLFSFFVGCTGILVIVSGLIFGTQPVFDFLLFKIMPYFRSAEQWNNYIYKSEFYHPFMNWTVMGGKIFRNISVFLSPISSAAFFGLLAPIALSFYLNAKQRNNIYLFIFLFAALNVLLTMTRGSWLPLFLALGFVFIKSRGTAKKILVPVIIVIFVAVLLSFKPYSERVFTTFAEKSSATTRVLFLKRGLEIAKANSLKGIGFANYERVVVNPIHEYPHNQYVELWAETGLGGLLAYLAVLVYVFRRNYKRIRSSENVYDKALYTGIVGSIMFFILYSFFEDLLAIPSAIMTFMLILGLSEADLSASLKTSKRVER